MTTRFDNYAETEIGQALIDSIAGQHRDAEFRLLSKPSIRIAAVQAVADDVKPIIEALGSKKERNSANQFVGWVVGQRMRALGYQLVQERGRVKNATFKTGAVWAPIET